MADPSSLIADVATPVRLLAVKDAFETLTEKEKLYAYHFARGAWLGACFVVSCCCLLLSACACVCVAAA